MNNEILSRIIETLAKHGSVSFVATIGGREITVGVSADPHEADQIKKAPGSLGEWAAAPTAMAGKIAAGVVVSAESTAKAVLRVMEPIKASPIGLTLEELAKKLDVRPRNRLKVILAALLKSGRLVKVGRRFRDADAKVTRGPKPRPPGHKLKMPGLPLSAAKLSALAKARAALDAARARARAAKRKGEAKRS